MNYLEAIVTVLAIEHFVMTIRFIYRDRKTEKQSKDNKQFWDSMAMELIEAIKSQNRSIESLRDVTTIAQKSWDGLEKQIIKSSKAKK